MTNSKTETRSVAVTLKPPIPKPSNFLLTVPLYEQTKYSGVEGWEIVETLFFRGTYDSFCTKCNRASTFQVTGPARPPELQRNEDRERAMRKLNSMAGMDSPDPALPPIRSGVHVLHAHCTRTHQHVQDFIFYADTGIEYDEHNRPILFSTFEKIGQKPSYADLHLANVKQYVPVLSKLQLRELSKAIGLASHGVGIGSYVYLRRIFEALVEDAHIVAKGDQNWNEEAFLRMRMGEKISTLKGHLPAFLVEHPAMYSILSKGIHELSEDDCIKHFATLRLGIEMILDEKLEKENQAKKSAAAKLALQKAIGQMSGDQ